MQMRKRAKIIMNILKSFLCYGLECVFVSLLFITVLALNQSTHQALARCIENIEQQKNERKKKDKKTRKIERDHMYAIVMFYTRSERNVVD